MKRLLFALATLAAAAQCAARVPVVRVGLPHSYEAVQRAAERCSEKRPVCYRYALGSDYQLLDWLQTGRIDAAAVPGLTLAVLQRAVGDKFHQEFLVATKLPLNDVQPRRYRVSLSEPEVRLDQYFHELLQSRGKRDELAVVELPSHLSAAVPEVVIARTEAWVGRQRESSGGRGAVLDKLRDALIGQLRFGAGSAGKQPRFVAGEEDGGPHSHFFVMRRLALPEELTPPRSDPGLIAENALLDALKLDNAFLDALKLEGRSFAANNYLLESGGWRNRFRFSFTLEELHGILRSHVRDPEQDNGIALVLTGGGVKAAYQTKLIDHLYGKGHLHNRLAAPSKPEPHAVPVNYVVGTSGGALLGIFVASLDAKKPHPDLSTKLWHQGGEAANKMLSAHKVFPWLDLMRWASLLYCVTIFAAVCAATSFVRRLRGAALDARPDEGGRFWRFTFWWLVVLGGTPWLLVYLNGAYGAEHIPATQGIFYGIFVLIAIYSDNRLVVRATARSTRRLGWPVLVMAAGAMVVLLAFCINDGKPTIVPMGDFSITLPALIACLGAALVFAGLHYWFERCAPRLEPGQSHALAVIALITGVFALSYGVLYPLTLLEYASTFELILVEFWGILGAIALAISVALAFFAVRRPQSGLGRLFTFLLAPHPSRGVVTLARCTRMVACAVAGWAWWNLAVAPGLYGNQDAFNYFKAAARNVFGPDAVKEVAGADVLDVKFRSYYVAPVTALQKGVERYVMFRPAEAYTSGARDAGLGSRSWVTISNDPRWVRIEDEKKQAELVMRVAFASGSPFPVFPAHRIELPVVGEQLLVDGGYAHNVPVEAAKRLGARRVLVINSSPREPAPQPPAKQPKPQPQEEEAEFQYLGNFALLLRWVVPYLYKRSQVEDALSGEDLLVASIAPSASAKGWPFLTDFRANVVKRMFEEAEKDQTLRIGSIENWGQPSFAARPTSGTLAQGSPEP